MNNPFSKLTFVLLLFVIHFVASAQNPSNESFDKDKMDLLFSIIDENDKAMGSISIFQNGEEFYQNSFGHAGVENNILATEKTIYRIGSISKTFTAAIIMQLVEENKLTLDTKLATYYPEIPNAKEITVEQLLRHRSGLFDFLNAKDLSQWMEEPISQHDFIQKFIDNGTVFSPDEKTEYSNTNYVLLSFIAEKIDGVAFSTILKNRITIPLKLNGTYFGGKIDTTKNEALSYKKVRTWELDTETDMSVAMGAGAVVSTPVEINLFYNALFDGKLVSDNSLSQMMKMGMGVGQLLVFDRTVYAHAGGIDGFKSQVAYFPGEKVSFAIAFNALAMDNNDIIFGALRIFFGKEYTLPDFKPALELSTTDLDVYLGIYGSPDFPFKITITKDENILILQAPVQSPVALEAYEADKFKLDKEGIKLHFLTGENNMVFKMGGEEHLLTKVE